MAKRRYEHRTMITRTLKTTSADILYFDRVERENRTQQITFNGKLDLKQFLRKCSEKVDGIVLAVDNLKTDSRLYACTVEEYLSVAKEITD